MYILVHLKHREDQLGMTVLFVLWEVLFLEVLMRNGNDQGLYPTPNVR